MEEHALTSKVLPDVIVLLKHMESFVKLVLNSIFGHNIHEIYQKVLIYNLYDDLINSLNMK